MEDNLKDKLNSDFIEEQTPKKPSKKMTIFNFALIAVIFLVLIIYMLNVDGLDNIVSLLQSVDYKWVFAGFLCLVAYWFCEAITLHIPLKKLYPDQKFRISFKISMIGLLFNNITPFASGGQPMQAYYLNKYNRRVSDSMSVLMIKFIIVQITLVIFSLAVVIIQFDFFAELMSNFLWIAVVGFSINVLAIAVAILAGVNKKAITIITNPVIKFLGKIKILKHPDATMVSLDKSIDNFAAQFKVMRSEKKMVAKMFLVAAIQCLVYYSITYMIYRAFGNSGVSIWQIIPAQAFLLLMMTFIPTPGSGLGAEGGFLLIFNSIFKEGTINMSILFWRLYTFYLPIIVGMLFLIPTKYKEKKKLKENENKEL